MELTGNVCGETGVLGTSMLYTLHGKILAFVPQVSLLHDFPGWFTISSCCIVGKRLFNASFLVIELGVMGRRGGVWEGVGRNGAIN